MSHTVPMAGAMTRTRIARPVTSMTRLGARISARVRDRMRERVRGRAGGRSRGPAPAQGAMTPRARVACLLLGFAAVLALGLFQVSRHRGVVQVGYAIGQTTSELRRLDEEARRLNLELSVLTSPARVERLAAELGMVRPAPAAIRTVRATPSLASARR